MIIIHSAQRYDASTLILDCTIDNTRCEYVLVDSDEHGFAPLLRVTLQAALNRGHIKIKESN